MKLYRNTVTYGYKYVKYIIHSTHIKTCLV